MPIIRRRAGNHALIGENGEKIAVIRSKADAEKALEKLRKGNRKRTKIKKPTGSAGQSVGGVKG